MRSWINPQNKLPTRNTPHGPEMVIALEMLQFADYCSFVFA